ncbi:hypothetical protein BP6252_04448 [Coleophoma cylindrospora]|uniref:Oxidase ustYa n=1 Tax=Coleophoma cylindrospora TaxID=1849047 RepID=A0A3D8S103_9HELO|nr:hypothetical protein BP6252_04448 [Coleophoma cylindrospora]
MDEDREKLLDASSETSSLEATDNIPTLRDRSKSVASIRIYKIFGCFLVFLLCLSNLFWYFQLPTVGRHSDEVTDPAYFGKPEKVLTSFDHDWNGLGDVEVDGVKYADDRWKHTYPKYGGSVALSYDYAAKYGLPLGDTTGDNSSEMHYLVAGYHQMHCLQVVRETIYQLNGTSTNTDPILWDHVLHCIEAVRQAVSCFMDPTLINLSVIWPGIPNGQRHVCRNKDALFAWTEEHAHPLPPIPGGPIH